jgi:hypothetical protein
MDQGLGLDRIFGLVAGIALLLFLLPQVLRLSPRQHRLMRRAAGGLIGTALAVAAALSLAWFAGIA